MRRAFTLVEVVAAAAIASIAGIALLQMNSQGMFLFSRLKERSAVSETLSIVGNHADKRFDHKDKTLYDLLDNTFKIENDELRKVLEKDKYAYSERVVDLITFDETSTDDSTEDLTLEDMENASEAPAIQFELIQVTIRNGDEHGAVILARPL